MQETLDILIKIQQFDDEVKSLNSKINKIPEQIDKSEKDIAQANANLKEQQERIQQIKKEYKLKEGDIAENETKINKLNSQIHTVKTNEEYRAIMNEINFLKKENEKIEDEMITLLEEEEKLKTTIHNVEKETAEYINIRKEKISKLKDEQRSFQEKMNQAKNNFDEYFDKLPADIKKMYKQIEKVRGKAVCLIDDEICTGCSTILTPQFLNELKKRNKILLCDNCGRILVYVARD